MYKRQDFGGVNWRDKELEVAPGNPVYKVKNNILYTADGKTVVFKMCIRDRNLAVLLAMTCLEKNGIFI